MRARKLGERLQTAQDIHIVSHIDADGLTAGAIAAQTLQRLGKSYSIEFVKQLDPTVFNRLKKESYDLVWFTDLGGSLVDSDREIPLIITDHHACSPKANKSFHLNPHLFGIDGGSDLSGAGTSYLVAKTLSPKNKDLASLAIVGACGDLQDRKHGKLQGYNREVLEDGKQVGVLDVMVDARFFGRETRPLSKYLQYANDPLLPGLSGRESACFEFLEKLHVPLKDKNGWRCWIHLGEHEKRAILSSLMRLLLTKGYGHEQAKRLLGEVYVLPMETAGTELHDAREFATLLNATARYGRFDVGLNLCLGDRKDAVREARSLLQGHRQNLMEGLQFAREEGIQQREFLQFFHAGTGIRDTIIGIVTNMLLHAEDTNNALPLIGFAEKGKSEVKASARGTQSLVDRGLNLSVAMKQAAEQFNGIGGGHRIAAGATIPKGKEEEFLLVLEQVIKTQLSP
jgi:single-stranded-DNA-specific exonuclease